MKRWQVRVHRNCRFQFVLRFRKPVQIQVRLAERFAGADVSRSNRHGLLQRRQRLFETRLLVQEVTKIYVGLGSLWGEILLQGYRFLQR